MSASEVDRKPVWTSLWIFDPEQKDDDDRTLVEAMPAAVSVLRSDEDRVLLAVRGKPKSRYEAGDSAWLELSNAEALRLIARLAAALGQEFAIPRRAVAA